MGFPTNSTGLSVVGGLKWLAIIGGVVALVYAYQGIIQKKGMTGTRGTGRFISGEAAVNQGWEYLGLAGICFLAAWALWFFWQRNED